MSHDDPLQTPVQFLPGVGPERAKLLDRLGLQTVDDVLWDVPRDVLDLTEVRGVMELRPDELQTVRGTVVDVESRLVSGGRFLAAVLLQCDDGYARGLWFNQRWIPQTFTPNMNRPVLFSGKPKFKQGRWEFSHPRIQWLEEDDSNTGGRVLPRYRLTEGLRMHERRRIARSAVERFAEFVPEYLPAAFREKTRVPELKQALTWLHCPETMEQYAEARRRVIFDDLLEFQAGIALRRRAWKKARPAPVLPTTAKIDARIRRLFPFAFTEGQNRAIREIVADIGTFRPMHRLLQADVGAGKTVVALYAMLVAIAAGYQTVVMVPTEVLATQHWETVERALAASRVRRVLLTGSLTPAQRRATLAEIESGEAQLVVGTQAVIQNDVRFKKLGLVVVDEQHKFGVAQRARFSNEQESPHVLVMTATPIPRSLCLTQFGDLDVTTISELPPGRQKIVTSRVIGSEATRRAWDFIRKQLQSGRQAYVICPRVEATVDDEMDSQLRLSASAEQLYRQLSEGELKSFRVGLVHGRLDRDTKAAAMEAFREGTTQVLVATTVVEVGVDVPNATLMIITQAQSFGLSQLHQLRGRIGRGKFQGYCFLLSENETPEGARRLAEFEATSDGFKIAEVDFELRGPGDVLGLRQHGELPLKRADLIEDREIVLEAREAAFDLVESAQLDTPEFRPFKARVLERFGHFMDLSQTG